MQMFYMHQHGMRSMGERVLIVLETQQDMRQPPASIASSISAGRWHASGVAAGRGARARLLSSVRTTPG